MPLFPLAMPARLAAPLLGGLALLVPSVASADWFGSGENRFEIPMVTIGSPGNAADTVTPADNSSPLPSGSVDYVYRIGKYEVPEEAVRKANAQSELDGTPLGLTLDERGPQKPATGLSWFEAAQFVNWLNEGRGLAPAYKFDASGQFQLWAPTDPGYNAANPFRNALAQYVLPSVDEWYKAAFYDPLVGGYWDYPTGSDDPPTPVASGTDPGTAVWNQTTGPADVQLAGGASPFGTVGQGGNVQEWQETATDLIRPNQSELRGIRGADWGLAASAAGMSSLSSPADVAPRLEFSPVGFRVVSVPEPCSVSTLAALLLLATRIRRSRPRRCDCSCRPQT